MFEISVHAPEKYCPNHDFIENRDSGGRYLAKPFKGGSEGAYAAQGISGGGLGATPPQIITFGSAASAVRPLQ